MADVVGFRFVAKILGGLVVRNVGVVVVAAQLEGAFRERGGFLEASGGIERAAENVPGTVAVGFAFDGTLGEKDGVREFFLGVGNAGAGGEHFRGFRSERGGAVAGSEAAV